MLFCRADSGLKALVAVAVVAALVGGAQLMLYMDKLGDVKHGLG